MTAILRLLALLPLPLLHLLGAAAGWMTFWSSPTYRRRFRAMASRAGVPWPLARPAVAHSGRMLAELPYLWTRPPTSRLAPPVRWEGEQLMIDALAARRGLVLLTPHLGCFELLAQAYAERFGQGDQPVTVLYRPARKAWLRDLVDRSRVRPGLDAAPATLAGVRQMIRALRRGQTVGLLPDQVPPQGQGVWAPFFGQPAYTMTLAARLVQQTGARWLLMSCERLPRARGYVVRVKAPLEPLPADGDPAESAAVINRAMEHLILEQPGQYLWAYHRYKRPRAAAAGE
jgi:KDO2-lipid IV(A) lauroyltransferase